MGVLEGSFAVAAFIVIALPGFIFSGIRRWLRGESVEDRDVGLTIARGAVFAVSLTATYLALFGTHLFVGLSVKGDSDMLGVLDPARVGLTVLGFYIIAPTVISVLLQIRHTNWQKVKWLEGSPDWVRHTLGWVRIPRSRLGYSSVPSAWDYAVAANANGVWVKVKRGNGEWIGGWYTGGSFATTYPEPRSLYIAEQYEITKKGSIKLDKAIPGTGVFLMIGDEDIVIWGKPSDRPHPEEGNND